jgi:hypothetical protein
MTNFINDSSLLSYLYDETGVYASIEIEEALEADVELSKRFKTFRQSLAQLPALSLEPSPSAVEAVLAYSRSTRLERETFDA